MMPMIIGSQGLLGFGMKPQRKLPIKVNPSLAIHPEGLNESPLQLYP